MATKAKYHIGIEIDRLTNSVQNTISGDSFATEVLEVEKSDLKAITKANNWLFDWKVEFKASDRKLYKLCIISNPHIIQGLVSTSDYGDHFYLHLDLTSERKNCTKAYLETFSHLSASSLGTKDMRVSSHSNPRPN